jgi:hypothetical protein
MLSLISTIFGFLAAGLPELLKFFQNKSDQKHELALAQMQNERELALAAQGFAAQAKIEEIKTEQVALQAEADMAKAEAETIKGAQEHDKEIIKRASPWVVNFNGLVRPAVTFIFVLELVGINVFLCIYLWNQPGMITDFNSLMAYVDVIFSDEELALLSGIISFWFGSRGWGAKK